jgi:hypothetical protein
MLARGGARSAQQLRGALGTCRWRGACAAAWREGRAAAPLRRVALCAKHVKKGDLPSKVCVFCNRPFNWCAVLLARRLRSGRLAGTLLSRTQPR